MLKNRAIRRSLYDFTVSLFETPPPDTGWGAYNVYSESQLRQARREKAFEPVEPYIYIVDAFVEPAQTELPLIVIEMSNMTDTYQLGDTQGRFNVARLHVFGKNRGQRDDFASMLQDVFAGNMVTSGSVPPFPIYDYPSGGSTVFVETAHIGPGVSANPIGVAGDEAFESSTLNWNEVSFSFRTKL